MKIVFRMQSTLFCALLFSGLCGLYGQNAVVLPPWQPGMLDLHHINTGKGNAALFIFPDGTTMLLDAGELDPISPRTNGPRNTPSRPNAGRTPGEWISRYVSQMLKNTGREYLDYGLITHFHDDHMGLVYATAATAKQGGYRLSGITEVAEHVSIKKLLDRGWPDYNYPAPLQDETMDNYQTFIKWQMSHRLMKMERFQAGRDDQIVLLYDPAQYKNFNIRNLAVNGTVWTGVDGNVRNYFPNVADLPADDRPSENDCSIALRISYGAFDYFNGGDLTGIPWLGASSWHDLETPLAQVTGPVEVNVLNHHGNRSSENATFLNALRPRVHIIQVWSSDHPGHDVLDRVLSKKVYPGPRDVFATGMLESNKLVIGELLDKLKSDQGHILVRVAKGGLSFQVIILDDTCENLVIRSSHGPYQCN